MQTMTITDFHAALKAQGVSHPKHCAVKCVVCGTIQSGDDWMIATGKSFDEINPKIGFSCIGRATGAGPHKSGAAPGNGCDWTLGGLFTIHKFEVIDGDGKAHPMFELATPEEAQAHEKSKVPA